MYARDRHKPGSFRVKIQTRILVQWTHKWIQIINTKIYSTHANTVVIHRTDIMLFRTKTHRKVITSSKLTPHSNSSFTSSLLVTRWMGTWLFKWKINLLRMRNHLCQTMTSNKIRYQDLLTRMLQHKIIRIITCRCKWARCSTWSKIWLCKAKIIRSSLLIPILTQQTTLAVLLKRVASPSEVRAKEKVVWLPTYWIRSSRVTSSNNSFKTASST